MFRQRGEPAFRGIVIVSSGVSNPVIAPIVVGQKWIQGPIEGKLQNLHAGKLKVVAQLVNIRSNFAQVLSDERQIAQCCFQVDEEVRSGPATQCPLMAVGWPLGICQAAQNPRK